MKRLIMGDIVIYEKSGDPDSFVIKDIDNKKYIVLPKDVMFKLGIGLMTLSDGEKLEVTDHPDVIRIPVSKKIKEIELKPGQMFMGDFEKDKHPIVPF